MHKWAFLREMIAQLGGGTWKPFTYNSDLLALDAAANVTRQFNVPLTDAKGFIWCEALYKCDGASVNAGTDVLFGGLTIQFDEGGGFGQLSKTAGPIESYFGRGGISGGAKELPYPVVFGGGTTTISGTLTNKTGGALNVYLSFIGVRKY